MTYKSSDFNADLYENDDFNSGARTDETTTKASTPTKERLINDRLASELSLYDDDVTLNSFTRLLKSFKFGLLQLLAIGLFITKGRFVRLE